MQSALYKESVRTAL